MGTDRVVLLTNHSLLAAGLQRLLQAIDGLELCTVRADDPRAAERIRSLDPQAIVLDSGDISMGDAAITQMLEEYPRAKVVALNLKRPGIEVFEMQRLAQTDLAALLEAIQGNRSPASGGTGAPPRTAAATREGGEGMDP